MIDQAHHAGVDDYVRQHGLQDSSLAESRRAKLQLPENSTEADSKEDEGQGTGQKDDYDEEDENEEDYMPPSDDDDDDGGGSGLSSSSSSASSSAGSSAGSAGRDLVREELGSEAEETH